MLFVSFFCHLALFFLIIWLQVFPGMHQDETPVAYVDLVTLPVASPQSGSPMAEPAPQPPAAVAAPSPPPPVSLPSAKPQAKAPKAKIQKPAAQDTRQFDERLAKLARQNEDKRQAEVLDKLRKKGRTGMPGAAGTEAGVDYASYLQSRLKDAFSREAVTSQVSSPMVIATITVGPDGRIADYHVENRSGDPLFDDAVARAVTIAGNSLRPPPGGGQFKRRFRFRPEGVGVR
jgi:colicin import membrane protein